MPAVARVVWPAGTYRIGHFVAGESQPDPVRHDLISLVALTGITVKSREPDAGFSSQYPSVYRYDEVPSVEFEAVPGQVNEWKLTLPPSLVEEVREMQAKAAAELK